MALAMTLLASAQQDDTPLSSISVLGGNDIKITHTPYAEYPDICEDRSGVLWVAYTSYSEVGGESIILKRVQPPVDSFVVSAKSGFEYKPRLYCDDKNTLWIVWAAKRDDNWDIYYRTFQNEVFGNERRVTNNPYVDIDPAVCGDSKGAVWIVWQSNLNGNFDIYGTRILNSAAKDPVAISISSSMDLRPAIVADKKGNLYVVWDRQVEGSYCVLMRKFNGKQWENEILLSAEIGFNVCPAIAVNKKGSMAVAWSSNIQPDGTIGFTPWIRGAILDGNKRTYFTPASENDQLKNGEEQGFEFPTLIYDREGKLWLFGRPSQGFYAQVIHKNKKSALYKFDVDGWGGRGQYVNAILRSNGAIATVRRDIRNVFFYEIPPVSDNIIVRLLTLTTRQMVKPEPTPLPMKHTRKPNDSLTLVFGDIHQHSSLSDGMGTADECYTRSRYVLGHDFAALTDHEWFTANMILPSEWEWIKIVGKQFEEAGVFVTLPAYEWTTGRVPAGFGHKNVYFSDWDQDIAGVRNNASTTTNLFTALKQHAAFAIPHHIGWTGIDWERHDTTVQPAIEIVSTHGAFEYMGNEPIMHRGGMSGYFVQDGWARGLVFGVTGSTDGHGLRWHHGIGRKENEWLAGFTGAYVKAKTRLDILDAIRNRRTYATSGARIDVDFRINGNRMGTIVHINDSLVITIEVVGTARLHYVKLLCDNKEVATFGKDIEEGRGLKTTHRLHPLAPGRHWFYLRVLQEDAEMAWSSPIWIDSGQ